MNFGMASVVNKKFMNFNPVPFDVISISSGRPGNDSRQEARENLEMAAIPPQPIVKFDDYVDA